MFIFPKHGFFFSLCMFLLCIFLLCPVLVYTQTPDDENQEILTFDFNLSMFLTGSGAYYFEKSEFFGGFETWISAHAGGNLGKNVSYFADIGVALLNINRKLLSEKEQMKVDGDDNNIMDIYSYPLGYFPYSYKSSWDGFVFPLSNLSSSGPAGWPHSTSIGFFLMGGVEGSAFNNILEWRLARIEREAAAAADGYSLALNKFAQPFLGFDLQLNMFPWLSIYHVTGILEYFASKGIKTSAATSQNAYSLTMLSLNYKEYVQADVGSSVIWPKRFELGYLFPAFHLLNQNNTGDFDNLGLFGNIKLKYPGLGFIWFSLFIDEINFESEFFNLAREMYAFQTGLRYEVPFIPSGLLTLSYTKIEPYCYTHQKTVVPWYNQPMEQAFMNHGYGLGYYLPPNSDELKLVLNAEVSSHTALDFQFQMIRHGAEYGEYKVFGSSYESELQEDDRSTDDRLRKDFLNDGAYQWFFVVKAGARYSINGIPATKKLQMEFLLNAGVVFSYWKLYEKTLDNAQYPSRTGIIMDVGFRITY